MKRPVILLVITTAAARLMCGCDLFGPTDNGSTSGLRVVSTQVFSGTTLSVESVRMDWSPDGQRIAFKADSAGANDVYRVRASAGSVPQKVTDYSSAHWDRGGYAPCFLDSNRIACYLGWIDSVNDMNMHVMVAQPTQVACVPAPVILHTFNASLLGRIANSAASPASLSTDASGAKGVFVWEAGIGTWSSLTALID